MSVVRLRSRLKRAAASHIAGNSDAPLVRQCSSYRALKSRKIRWWVWESPS